MGAHCILRLLADGYQVRTTVRGLGREAEVRAQLAVGGAAPGQSLSFAVADLSAEDGWSAAVKGCDYVLHVASPFPLRAPKREDELIEPAREGSLRVLRAARDGGVKRVVLTSSFAAIGYGTVPASRTYTEKDWTDPDGGVSAYGKSKTLAERAAWRFVEQEGEALELAVVNPVAIYGPVLGPKLSTSVQLVQRLLAGSLPALPRVSAGVVDVRDVADLHVRAMTSPDAVGERFLAAAGDAVAMPEVARMLRERIGAGSGSAAAAKVPTRVLPDWTVRLGGLFVSDLKEVAGRLGVTRNPSSEKARQMLGWSPRSSEEALVATAESLIRLDLV